MLSTYLQQLDASLHRDHKGSAEYTAIVSQDWMLQWTFCAPFSKQWCKILITVTTVCNTINSQTNSSLINNWRRWHYLPGANCSQMSEWHKILIQTVIRNKLLKNIWFVKICNYNIFFSLTSFLLISSFVLKFSSWIWKEILGGSVPPLAPLLAPY